MSNPKLDNSIDISEITGSKRSNTYEKGFDSHESSIIDGIIMDFSESGDDISLSSNSEDFIEPTTIQELSDEQIIKLTKYKIPDGIEKALEKLLKSRQEGSLSEFDQFILDNLIKIYDEGLLLKSEALRVAVERGLIEPLSK